MKMPIKAALTCVASFATAMIPLLFNANKAYQDGPARDSAVLMARPDMSQEAYDEACTTLDVYHDLIKREGNELKDRMLAWEDETEFRRKMNSIRADASVAKTGILVSVDRDKDISKMEKDREMEIKALKNALEYDKKLSRYNKNIKQAEQKWQQEQDLFSRAGKDATEAATALKHDAEKRYNEAVAKAKNEIATLNERVEALRERWNDKIEAKKIEKHTDAQHMIEEIEKKADQAADDLIDKRHEAEAKFLRELKGIRTPEEANAVATYSQAKRRRAEIEKFWKESAKQTTMAASLSQKLAWWLENKHIPRWCVLAVGLIPLIAYSVVGVGYSAKLIEVFRLMAKVVI